jgi:hypothetical protein
VATAPLFVANLATLQAKLRLSGMKSDGNGVDLLNEAILRVRVGFYRKLGTTRVATLVALLFSETPTTTDQVLRALANTTETNWVRLELFETMPTLFMDASAETTEAWNTEAAFRQGKPSDKTKRALWNQISRDLDILSGAVSLGDETQFKTDTIEPDVAPPLPGDSLFYPFGREP